MIATENLKGRSGVYCAIHRDSLKCYVGSSRNMHERRLAHLERVNGPRCTSPFHRALRDLGPASFDFEVLEFCKPSQLSEREDFWIKFYECAGLKGFNTNPTSTYFRIGNLSEATKARMREAHKNRAPITEETRRKRSESCKGRVPGMLGKHHSEETKSKIGASNASVIRKPLTFEHRRNIGLGLKARYLKNKI
jgi:group I intron endonuclease